MKPAGSCRLGLQNQWLSAIGLLGASLGSGVCAPDALLPETAVSFQRSSRLLPPAQVPATAGATSEWGASVGLP